MARTREPADEVAEQLRHVVRGLRRRMRAEAADDLPYPQLSLLRRLEDGPATTADLARAELITPQSAGALVAELAAASLVTRRPDAHDGRRMLVALAPAGRKVLARGRAARQSWLATQIADRLDAREQRALAAALLLVQRILDT
jgi:DNA-binding MarR family transcriptional regulator